MDIEARLERVEQDLDANTANDGDLESFDALLAERQRLWRLKEQAA